MIICDHCYDGRIYVLIMSSTYNYIDIGGNKYEAVEVCNFRI
jgi:hypothetical protein